MVELKILALLKEILMSLVLRSFGLMLPLPSLAYAARLEIPGDGAELPGIGALSEWKCEAEGGHHNQSQ